MSYMPRCPCLQDITNQETSFRAWNTKCPVMIFARCDFSLEFLARGICSYGTAVKLFGSHRWVNFLEIFQCSTSTRCGHRWTEIWTLPERTKPSSGAPAFTRRFFDSCVCPTSCPHTKPRRHPINNARSPQNSSRRHWLGIPRGANRPNSSHKPPARNAWTSGWPRRGWR